MCILVLCFSGFVLAPWAYSHWFSLRFVTFHDICSGSASGQCEVRLSRLRPLSGATSETHTVFFYNARCVAVETFDAHSGSHVEVQFSSRSPTHSFVLHDGICSELPFYWQPAVDTYVDLAEWSYDVSLSPHRPVSTQLRRCKRVDIDPLSSDVHPCLPRALLRNESALFLLDGRHLSSEAAAVLERGLYLNASTHRWGSRPGADLVLTLRQLHRLTDGTGSLCESLGKPFQQVCKRWRHCIRKGRRQHSDACPSDVPCMCIDQARVVLERPRVRAICGPCEKHPNVTTGCACTARAHVLATAMKSISCVGYTPETRTLESILSTVRETRGFFHRAFDIDRVVTQSVSFTRQRRECRTFTKQLCQFSDHW